MSLFKKQSAQLVRLQSRLGKSVCGCVVVVVGVLWVGVLKFLFLFLYFFKKRKVGNQYVFVWLRVWVSSIVSLRDMKFWS